MIDQIKNRIITILFVFVLVTFLILNIIKKDQEISLSERRKLEQFPSISINNLIDGTFFQKFDQYSLDQFIKRDQFRSLKAHIELQLKKEYHQIYLDHDYLIEQLYPINQKSLEQFVLKINQIQNMYLKNNQVYFSIIPDKNYFGSSNHLKMDYSKLEAYLKQHLNMDYIDIMDSLTLKNYYLTDPHWKQETLIEVASTLSNGLKVPFKNDYEVKKIANFKGTYAYQLPIQTKQDELKVLVNDTIQNSYLYNYETKKETKLYYKNQNSIDPYDIYLSGSTPIVTIQKKETHTGKELIIFRDSFASSLAPLLLNGYDKITLIDTRYISPKLIGNYIEIQNQDILFLYSTLIINNSFSLKS